MGTPATFWNRFAKRYAAAEIKDVATHERRMQTIETRLESGMDVLDMACGSGVLAVRMAPLVKHIDAIDISKNMIEIARARARDAGAANTSFSVASVEEFKAPGGSFDAVLALSILHLLDDPRAAIAKSFDLLRPGGVLISNSHCISSNSRRLKFFLKVGVPLGLMPNLQFFSKPDLLAAHRDAGFRIEEEWQPGDKKPVTIVARKPA